MAYRDATLNDLGRDPVLWGKGLDTGVEHDALIRGLQDFSDTWVVRCAAKSAKEDGLAQPFWNELLPILGVPSGQWVFERASVRKSTQNTGEIDVFIPGLLLVENKSPKSPKRVLDDAMEQAWDYIEGYLVASEKQPSIPRGEQPRFVIGCNLTDFRVYDRVLKVESEFSLKDLAKHASEFWFITGSERSTGDSNIDLDKRAAALMANVYDELVADGVEDGVAASVVMRLMFLCVADDLSLLGGSNSFTTWLDTEVREDGSDLGIQLMRLFRILNTPRGERQRTVQDNPQLNRFPYVNGSMFEESLSFDIDSPTALVALRRAARYDWSDVDPAIFGAMFQRLRSRGDRHALGQHYTSEVDILRVIEPLFLDELRERFELARGDRRQLTFLREDMRGLTFLDPAAGSGNFLLVAFKHLSRLDLEVARELRSLDGKSHHQMSMVGTEGLVNVSLDQFHGIEIDAWPAELARTALHIARAQANRAVEREFGLVDDLTFPLPTFGEHGGVVHGNALVLDWSELVSFREGTYIFGNPPFLGSLMMSDGQKTAAREVWSGDKRFGTMDFVTNWFLLAGRYMEGTRARAAFVSTNSITQGEQPAVLWGQLYPLGMSIDFAYRTFPWRNGAGQQAAVHCVIIGFSANLKPTSRPLWTDASSGGKRTEATNINGYLVDGPNVLVTTRLNPLVEGITQMRFGSMPRDGGFLSKIDAAEAERIRNEDPVAAKYLKPLLGSAEMLGGKRRYCLWLKNLDPKDALASKELQRRLDGVRAMRLASDAPSTRKWAEKPHLFVQDGQPTTSYLAAPCYATSSRKYLLCDYLTTDVIASNKLQTIESDEPWLFGILSSSVFSIWHNTVSGGLGSAPNLSAEITYNNFPFPDLDDDQQAHIANCAQTVLDARAAHPDATLADLYNNKTFYLYTDLKAAHDALDKAVLAAYGLAADATDAEILKVLFERYVMLVEAEKAKSKKK